MVDAAAQAFTRAGIYRVGLPTVFQRLVGSPPNVTLSPLGGAMVIAVVRDYLADTTQTSAAGYSASQIGSVTEGDRQILVMADDLDTAGFPLPLQKGDQVVAAGEVLVLTKVDASKRYMAGCIECAGLGVA